MPKAILLTLALLTAFPSQSRTTWMRLEAFRLAIGMSRYDAMQAVKQWHPKKGKDADEIVVDYASDKSLTMEFRKDRLHSVRFELFTLLPETRFAFAEERSYLQEALGAPRKATPSLLIYDNKLPNVIVAVADNPKSAQGKRGLGVLAVRFYDPR